MVVGVGVDAEAAADDVEGARVRRGVHKRGAVPFRPFAAHVRRRAERGAPVDPAAAADARAREDERAYTPAGLTPLVRVSAPRVRRAMLAADPGPHSGRRWVACECSAYLLTCVDAAQTECSTARDTDTWGVPPRNALSESAM